jgi:hypothetical protein
MESKSLRPALLVASCGPPPASAAYRHSQFFGGKETNAVQPNRSNSVSFFARYRCRLVLWAAKRRRATAKAALSHIHAAFCERGAVGSTSHPHPSPPPAGRAVGVAVRVGLGDCGIGVGDADGVGVTPTLGRQAFCSSSQIPSVQGLPDETQRRFASSHCSTPVQNAPSSQLRG